jgi:hypothetical protein
MRSADTKALMAAIIALLGNDALRVSRAEIEAVAENATTADAPALAARLRKALAARHAIEAAMERAERLRAL